LEIQTFRDDPNVYRIRKSIEQRIAKFARSVPSMIDTCKTSVDVLGDIYGDDGSNERLLELEFLAEGSSVLTEEEIETLCLLAVTTSKWTEANEKDFNALITKVIYRLDDWPNYRWQSRYEKRCAESGLFVRLGDHEEKKANTINAFMAMETDEQLSELCQLLAEPIPGGQFPESEVLNLEIAAWKVNFNARLLNQICSFRTLKDREPMDLMMTETLLKRLRSTKRKSLVELCETTDPSGCLSNAFERKFMISIDEMNRNRHMAPTLDTECSKFAPFYTWGSIDQILLTRFEEVVSMDLSKIDMGRVCNILKTNIMNRANESTAPTADRQAMSDLDAIARKYGFGIRRTGHKLLRGLVKRLRTKGAA
jgi:hypothetical protein